MNKKTHRMFAEILWRHLAENYGIHLNRLGFVLGNVAPDLTFSFVIHPHERAVASGHVRQSIAALVEGEIFGDFDAGFVLAERLGSLCHYCADFFCEAHTPRYQGTVREHYQYEKALCHYCRVNRRDLEQRLRGPEIFEPAAWENIFEELERRNDAYLAGEATFGAQAEGALGACLNLVGTIMVTRCYGAAADLALDMHLGR
ncbi:MAG: zinc dependent phospholipase C family protein [Eubacterium sp.]|nr:zinc dependent phospholipase C family protein [Eubacterium sp.]